jgi:hypothetical protein
MIEMFINPHTPQIDVRSRPPRVLIPSPSHPTLFHSAARASRRFMSPHHLRPPSANWRPVPPSYSSPHTALYSPHLHIRIVGVALIGISPPIAVACRSRLISPPNLPLVRSVGRPALSTSPDSTAAPFPLSRLSLAPLSIVSPSTVRSDPPIARTQRNRGRDRPPG